MLNFGWAELMVIGVVALIVIGPEDLPAMFRQMGRFTAKLRQMSREFSRAMEQAAKETGVKDVATDLKGLTSTKAMGLDAVKSAADKFEKWDPMKNAAKPSAPLVTSTIAKPLVPAAMPATLAPTPTPAPAPLLASAAPAFDPADLMTDDIDPEALDDMAEWDADLAGAAIAAPTAAPTPAPSSAAPPLHGPATQALYDKQAAKAAVMAEQTAKLKAIDDGTYQPQPTVLPPVTPPVTAPKKRVAKPKAGVEGALAMAEPVETQKPAKPARKSSKKAVP